LNQDKLTVSSNNIRLLVLEVIQKELVDLKENVYEPNEIIKKSEAILSLLTIRERFKEDATAATVAVHLDGKEILNQKIKEIIPSITPKFEEILNGPKSKDLLNKIIEDYSTKCRKSAGLNGFS
jgi:hypothetical protein